MKKTEGEILLITEKFANEYMWNAKFNDEHAINMVVVREENGVQYLEVGHWKDLPRGATLPATFEGLKVKMKKNGGIEAH